MFAYSKKCELVKWISGPPQGYRCEERRVQVPSCTFVSKIVAASIHFGEGRVHDGNTFVSSKKIPSAIQLTDVMSVNRSPPK
jgi:hypothetical protein